MFSNNFKVILRKFFKISQRAETIRTEPSIPKNPQSYLFISKERGEQLKVKYHYKLDNFSDKELIVEYNQINKFRGVPELGNLQGLYLKAVHEQFIERFEKSPFIIEGNYRMRLGGYIVYYEFLNTFEFLNAN